MEEYRDIKGYEGKYQVSDAGNVYSVKRGIVLRPQANKNYGYPQVMLWDNCTVKLHYVHRLVAEAFVENPDNYKIVTHINGDKNNNAAGNLKWVEKAVHKRLQEVPKKNDPYKDRDILVKVIEEINREKRDENGTKESK